MFTTNPVVLSEKQPEDSSDGNLTYSYIAATDHKPFLIATFSTAGDCGEMGVDSVFTGVFEIVSNVSYNCKEKKLEKIQLMKPTDELIGGWQLHDIILCRTIKTGSGMVDEYITSEGNSFIFNAGTLDLSKNLSEIISYSKSHTNYQKFENIIHFK